LNTILLPTLLYRRAIKGQGKNLETYLKKWEGIFFIARKTLSRGSLKDISFVESTKTGGNISISEK